MKFRDRTIKFFGAVSFIASNTANIAKKAALSVKKATWNIQDKFSKEDLYFDDVILDENYMMNNNKEKEEEMDLSKTFSAYIKDCTSIDGENLLNYRDVINLKNKMNNLVSIDTKNEIVIKDFLNDNMSVSNTIKFKLLDEYLNSFNEVKEEEKETIVEEEKEEVKETIEEEQDEYSFFDIIGEPELNEILVESEIETNDEIVEPKIETKLIEKIEEQEEIKEDKKEDLSINIEDIMKKSRINVIDEKVREIVKEQINSKKEEQEEIKEEPIIEEIKSDIVEEKGDNKMNKVICLPKEEIKENIELEESINKEIEESVNIDLEESYTLVSNYVEILESKLEEKKSKLVVAEDKLSNLYVLASGTDLPELKSKYEKQLSKVAKIKSKVAKKQLELIEVKKKQADLSEKLINKYYKEYENSLEEKRIKEEEANKKAEQAKNKEKNKQRKQYYSFWKNILEAGKVNEMNPINKASDEWFVSTLEQPEEVRNVIFK